MARQFAGDAEVAAGAHEPCAEQLLPETVHRDAGRQRVVGSRAATSRTRADFGGSRARQRRQRRAASPAFTASRRLSYSPRKRMNAPVRRAFVHHVGDRAADADRGFLLLAVAAFSVRFVAPGRRQSNDVPATTSNSVSFSCGVRLSAGFASTSAARFEAGRLAAIPRSAAQRGR